ncbi:MAG: hypothetical protein NVSMB26_13800 [Beijerinckiaceae bacterium]
MDTLASLNVELKLCRIGHLLRKYSPDRPRVPAGYPDGGQWTSGGASGATDQEDGAGPGSLDEGRSASDGDKVPEIPKERPATAKERTRAVKLVVRSPADRIRLILEAAGWLKEYGPVIESYFDFPATLGELQSNVADPSPGYDIHHIVEQTPAEQDGFPRSQIDAPENLVRVPRLKHWEINGWFQASNEVFNGLSPREYLRGKSWDERTRVGLMALIERGVLAP